MADNAEKDRITNMEDQMKQLIMAVQQMSTEIKTLRANSVHVPTLIGPGQAKQKGNLNAVDDDMPDLEDDSVAIVVEKVKSEESKIEQDKRFAKLEDQIRQLQGSQSQSPTDLSVYAKVKVPSKFKMPEFEKYDGTSCPRAHLQMYLVRMTQYVNNAPLMINSFQASLTGPALRWYITKKINLFEAWEEVNDAFLKQYKFIMDITPSREDLERAEKKKTESFKEYAIRWRNLAAQISPEPTDQELRRMFIKTLPYEYRTRMVTTTVDSFNQLIPVGEQIEIGLRDGWFVEPVSSGKRFSARKEKEPAAEVNAAYTQQNRENRIQSIQVTGGQQQNIGQQSFPRRTNRRQFTPLPGPLSQVLAILRKKGLLTSEPKRPNSEQFASYDSSKKCDYHMGEIGHSTDDCFTLKHKIQNLLDTKAFSFQTAQPNVRRNPLPDHVGEVNAVFESNAGRIRSLRVRTVDVYDGLVRAGYYSNDEKPSLPVMKTRVVEMVKAGMITHANHSTIVSTLTQIINWEDELAALHVGRGGTDPVFMDMSSLEGELTIEEPAAGKGVVVEMPTFDEEIIIEVPQPYEYVDNKKVPWSYDLDVDLVTRSGRTYAQANTQPARPVTDEEAKEFLAVIKASEYNVVEQLRKMPAQISLLELLQTSVKHQKALMKVLSEIHVPETVESDKLEEFVGSVLLKDLIAFSDEEFPMEGRGHTKALYVSVKCKASHVARVLIDNGSALNICPLATLLRLGIDTSKIRAAKTSVRAFDGTKKDVLGEIDLDVQIGPTLFNILFQVMDIPTAFNFLLGRPWIHTAGAVPSSLHQRLKFVTQGKLVTVHGEEEHRIFHETTIPYVEPDCEIESSYQSFELVSTVHASRGSSPPVPNMSSTAVMVGRVMAGNSFVPGEGLGREGQGIRMPIEAPRSSHTSGLGYRGRGGRNGGGRGRGRSNLVVPHIRTTFPRPAGFMHEEEEAIYSRGLNNKDAEYPEPEDQGIEMITSLFDEVFIGAINEELAEERGAGPRE